MKIFIPNLWTSGAWGIVRGYAHIFEKFSSGLAELGASVTHDENADVDVDLYICPPGAYRRRRNASVLYTMWEDKNLGAPVIHEDNALVLKHLEGLRRADHIVVPSSWCVEIFKPHFNGKIDVVPLAVDQEYSYKKRNPKLPFRWLYVGASNYRKGIDVIEDVWKHLLNNPNMELYIKTTGGEAVEQGKFQTDSNVIVDTRRLSLNDLVEVYHSADAFLFPTAGEGFGLTLAEAMSTGLPCICTEYGGHLDFTDSDSVFYIGMDDNGERVVANAAHLAREMKHVVSNYRKALLKGKRASRAVSRLTWDSSCRGVYTTLKHARRHDLNG